MEQEPLKTCEEVAEYLGVQPSTVRRLAAKGDIPGVKIGRQWRFKMETLVQWIEQRSEQNGSMAKTREDILGPSVDPEDTEAN